MQRQRWSDLSAASRPWEGQATAVMYGAAAVAEGRVSFFYIMHESRSFPPPQPPKRETLA